MLLMTLMSVVKTTLIVTLMFLLTMTNNNDNDKSEVDNTFNLNFL